MEKLPLGEIRKISYIVNIKIDAMKIHIHHYHHYAGDFETKQLLTNIYNQNNLIMKTIEALQAAVAEQSTVIDSAIVLIHGLADQIEDLELDEAAVSELVTKVRAQADALANAVEEGTGGEDSTTTSTTEAEESTTTSTTEEL